MSACKSLFHLCFHFCHYFKVAESYEIEWPLEKEKPTKLVAFTGENFVPALSSPGIVINGRWNMLYKTSWENKAVHRWPGAFLAVSESVNTH